MSYRFLNPAPVFFNIPGTKPLAGGSLSFYEIGTTTEKDTFSDPDLVTPNANPVPLDSSGRSATQIWLDGDYTVVLKDSFGATVWTRDVTSGISAGATIPPFAPGFLTNDLSNYLWREVREVPDPMGSVNYILSTDGTAIFWIPKPSDVPDIEVTSGSFLMGDTLVQFGNDLFPIPIVVPHHGAVKAVVFPIAFGTCRGVICGSNKNQIAVSGFKAIISAEYDNDGFTAEYNTNENSTDPNGEVNVTIPFSWIAWGSAA